MGHVTTETETFSTLRQFWLKHCDAMEVFIMDQGTEFGDDFQHLCQSREILPVVTDLETPWQNSVVERHGALFKMVFEKACSLESPTTEAEVNELIDFMFAELNRRVGRVGFSPGQRVFGRQLRLPSSLLEDDFIDPYMIAQDATHEMRRCEAMRMAAAHGCVVAADRRAMSTASHSRQREPQWLLVAGEPVFIDGRMEPKDGVDWCVRPERRTEAWTKRDSLGAHAKLLAQVQSHTGEARNQRRSGRNRNRHITTAGSD